MFSGHLVLFTLPPDMEDCEVFWKTISSERDLLVGSMMLVGVAPESVVLPHGAGEAAAPATARGATEATGARDAPLGWQVAVSTV